MKQTYTDGTVIYTIDNCDCGLTAGCKKCQPIIIKPDYYSNPKAVRDVLNRMQRISARPQPMLRGTKE